MIDEKTFLEYQLEQEKRFSKLEQELLVVKKDLEILGLRQNSGNQYPAPVLDEKVEEENKKDNSAGLLLQYSEDEETLRKLGFELDKGGN